MRILTMLLASVIGTVVFATCKDLSGQPKTLTSLDIVAVGDILMHGAVKASAAAADSKAKSGYEFLFNDIAAEIQSADIAFANLETPIAPKKGQGTRAFVFNAPPVLLPSLKNIGFDILSIANNHVYDQGRPGFIETMKQLKKSGISYVGGGKTKAKAQEPVVLAANGIKVAFLAYTEFFNDDLNVENNKKAYANYLDTSTLFPALHWARESADFVVVSIHWGDEYKSKPRKSTKSLAYQIFEEGADVILGHHPHVLQPIEVYQTEDQRHCFVIYSLGNFISNQSRFYVQGLSPNNVGDTRDSAIIHFSVRKREYGHGIIRHELFDLYFTPIWTENNFFKRKRGNRVSRIKVVAMRPTMKKVKSEIENLNQVIKNSPSISAETEITYLGLTRYLETLQARHKTVLRRLGENYVKPENKSVPTISKGDPKIIRIKSQTQPKKN